MKKKNFYLLLIIVFGGFLVFGFSENIKGPAIPKMQAEFTLSELQVGLLLAFNSLGYLLACSFTGFLTKRYGIRFSSSLAFGTMALGMKTGYAFIGVCALLCYAAAVILYNFLKKRKAVI